MFSLFPTEFTKCEGGGFILGNPDKPGVVIGCLFVNPGRKDPDLGKDPKAKGSLTLAWGKGKIPVELVPAVVYTEPAQEPGCSTVDEEPDCSTAEEEPDCSTLGKEPDCSTIPPPEDVVTTEED